MPNEVDLAQKLELRDNLERLQQLEAERQQWKQVCKEVTEERDRLRAEVAKLRSERDQYLKSLYALIPSQFTFDEQELLTLEQNGLTLDQIMEQLPTARGA